MYKHIFGPVPSRRLGMSLGIDLVPHKVCSLNCVYCECGRTTDLTLHREEYISAAEILDELQDFFSKSPKPDYLTLSGSGEPTLNVLIGSLIEEIKQREYGVPIAVLTNGTMFSDAAVRAELLMADLILPSLDAASDLAFKKINRPAHGVEIGPYIDGLAAFQRAFTGPIWMEIMIVPGINDSNEETELLRKAMLKIRPDKIQLNTLDRPGAVSGLPSASYVELLRIKEQIEGDDDARIKSVEIIAACARDQPAETFRTDTESAILETIFRRPCTAGDLAQLLNLPEPEIENCLQQLSESKKIEPVKLKRGLFFRIVDKEK